ncbi:MAG TPA: tetratricopeptide repeat protein [Bacteroidales bacterium]|nr:tetratricopeptide repeat protein [Bacteroidales bacterium]
MRIRIIFLLILIATIGLSCSMNKEVTQQAIPKKKELNKNTEQYYYYVFLEANRKKILGDINGALSLYYQSLEINPESAAAMSEIALLNEILNNYTVALKYAEKAVNKDSDNKWYKINLARLYIVGQSYDKAIDIYKQLYKQNPDDLDIPYNMAALYSQIGDYKSAINLYDEIENKTGIIDNLSLAKQRLYLEIGNKTKAYNEIEKLIKHFPENPAYYGILAEMYTNDNLFLKADENYKKLFELDSLNTMGQLSIINFYRKKVDYENVFKVLDKIISNKDIEFQQKLMILVSMLNNPNEFNIYHQEIEEQLSLLKDIHPETKDAYTLYADYLIKMNLLNEAKNEINFIVSNFKANEIIWEQLLSILLNQNEFESLYSKSEIAIDSFPQNSIFYLYNGLAASRINKYNEAVKSFNKGLAYVENNKDLELQFYTFLAETYYEIKDFKKSDYYYDQVIKEQPDNVYVLNNYSYYLSLRDEKLDYAEQLSKKTILAEPNNSTYLDTYAWILYKQKKYAEALIYIKRAYLNGGDKNDVIVEHYGDIQYKNGNLDEAVQLWEKSKELGNKSEQLQIKIDTRKLE